jgi:hypothetical protein
MQYSQSFDVLQWTLFFFFNSFDMASDALSNTKILAPCYYILGGNSSGQVSVWIPVCLLFHLPVRSFMFVLYMKLLSSLRASVSHPCQYKFMTFQGIVITRERTKSLYPMRYGNVFLMIFFCVAGGYSLVVNHAVSVTWVSKFFWQCSTFSYWSHDSPIPPRYFIVVIISQWWE